MTTSDVVVAGSTTVALAVAHRLVEWGATVTVLEPGRLGARPGAGMASMALETWAHRLSLRWDREVACAWLEQLRAGIDEWAGLAASWGVAVERPQGWIGCFDGHLAFQLRHEARALRSVAESVTFVDTQPLATAMRPALTIDGQLRLDPAALHAAQVAELRRRGVTIVDGTPIRRFSGSWVETDVGRYHGMVVDAVGISGPIPGVRETALAWADVALPLREPWPPCLLTLVDSDVLAVSHGPERTRVFAREGVDAGRLRQWLRNHAQADVTAEGSVAVQLSGAEVPVVRRGPGGVVQAGGWGLWDLGFAASVADDVVYTLHGGSPMTEPRLAGVRQWWRRRVGLLADPVTGVARVLRRRGMERDVSAATGAPPLSDR